MFIIFNINCNDSIKIIYSIIRIIKNFTKYIEDDKGNKIFLPFINKYKKVEKKPRNSIFSTIQSNKNYSKTYSNNLKKNEEDSNYESEYFSNESDLTGGNLNNLLKNNLYGKKGREDQKDQKR